MTIVETLLAKPFPAEEKAGPASSNGRAASGPGYHVVVLAASEEFWDDSDGSQVRAAGAKINEEFRKLTAPLIADWGPPKKARFRPTDGPLAHELTMNWGLGGGDLWVRGDRVVLVAVAQVDKEFALELIVGVGQMTGPTGV